MTRSTPGGGTGRIGATRIGGKEKRRKGQGAGEKVPTFCNEEVEAQRRRWTFYETILQLTFYELIKV